ncbi:hypothetical protein A3D62_03210 [Candidatus Kaiserbacteria bacterium RIFCSPHIGHO2_02_FULL_49_11]|uniref:Reverse transcriptase domain-containing protein n=1 Tax=Candidatus Kaiserbacteria bacterium RIFCSPHIGHO2_02_FULL_49_11 TaxID=1798489 RepID=A0A1F6D0X8_9BACT|nr:MAG: hypothetical protein A3D62_03210 [Candidatus Kaiserbacteria bacterium RIFCSPHIGHO2_02_FULL_49_11]
MIALKSLVPLPLFGGAPTFNPQNIFDGKKWRTVQAPNNVMRKLHKELIEVLLELPIDFTSATGSLPGKSNILNANVHAGNQFFYIFDMKDAFPSVPIDRLADTLHVCSHGHLGTRARIRSFLEDYCAGPRGLAVGAPASPLLFNIYCAVGVDPGIRKLLRSDTIYTRYVDDLVISSSRPIPRILRKRIRKVVTDAGFAIKDPKSKVLDKEKGPVTITGVVIDKKGRIAPTKECLAEVEDLLWIPPQELTPEQQKRIAGFASYLQSFREFGRQKLAEGNGTVSTAPLSPVLDTLAKRCRIRLRENKKPRTQKQQMHLVFPEVFIDEIRATASLRDVIEPYLRPGKRGLRLKKVGGEWAGLCPFHNEKTPSFTIAEEKGFFHCFGCGNHGSVIDFIMRVERLEFPDAVRFLAKKYDLPLPERKLERTKN